MPNVGEYIKSVGSGVAAGVVERLDVETQLAEYLFMGLRTFEGIDLREAEQRFKCDVMLKFGAELARFIKEKLVALDTDEKRLRLTEQGMRFSNEVFEIFVK